MIPTNEEVVNLVARLGTTNDKTELMNLMKEVVLTTKDKGTAEEALAQWGAAEEEGRFALTVLGLVNGILPALTDKVLVYVIDEETQEVHWRIDDVWWGKGDAKVE